jgi:hypothetical protein
MDITSLKSSLSRLLRRLRPSLQQPAKEGRLKSFSTHQQKEGTYNARRVGYRSVPVQKIIGSVGRYHDFDSRFRPTHENPHRRVTEIKKALQAGKSMPPVDLYQIRDEYYVLDGNHRVAAARQLGRDEIEANIVELIPSLDTLENILYREKRDFKEATGLRHEINLTEVGQYARISAQITAHQRHLDQQGTEPVTFEKAAADWYRTIYVPLAAILKKGRLVESFPQRTVGDLYAYISVHLWDIGASRQYGIGIGARIPKDMEAFRTQMLSYRKEEYPDMEREITAFILMNVEAKREHRIIDRLYALEQVREIHSVHGAVDMLVKVVLRRDLVSSDAEVIGRFVHDQVRQIQGIVRTQTLIPSISKTKAPAATSP